MYQQIKKRGYSSLKNWALCYDYFTMKIFLSLILLLISLPSVALEALTPMPPRAVEATGVAGDYILTAEMWARPRSGQAILTMPPVRDAVQNLIQKPGSHLLIRYPGGDEGSIWAEELQSWLISLGIEPTLIEMRPGSTPEQIELQLMSTTSVK